MINTVRTFEYKRKNKPSRVGLYYNHNSVPYRISLGYLWSEYDANELDIKLKKENLSNMISDYFIKYKVYPSVSYIRRKFNFEDASVSDDIFKIFDTFLNKVLSESNIGEKSIKSWYYFKSLLERFDKVKKIRLDIIDDIWVTSFQNFLFELGISDNTHSQFLSKLKSFLKYLITEKKINIDIFGMDIFNRGKTCNWDKLHYGKLDTFKKGDIMSEGDTFSPALIKYLMDNRKTNILNTPKKTRQRKKILDLLLFQIFTGLSFCDAIRVRKNHVKDGNRIEIKRQKTNQISIIPIDSIVLEILEENNFNLDFYPLYSYYHNLKSTFKYYSQFVPELREVIEIRKRVNKKEVLVEKFKWELVSSVVFRRTKATTLANMGKTTNEMMKVMGWKTDMAQTYIDRHNNKNQPQKSEMEDWVKNNSNT
jgi:integrase